MELKIDKSGRIVVPKKLRDRLGLRPGRELEAREQAGGLLLTPVDQKPSMVMVDGIWVHQGVAEPGFDWNRVVEDAREERIQHLLKFFKT